MVDLTLSKGVWKYTYGYMSDSGEMRGFSAWFDGF